MKLKRKLAMGGAFAATAMSVAAFGAGSASAMSYDGYGNNSYDSSYRNSSNTTYYAKTTAFYQQEVYFNKSNDSSRDSSYDSNYGRDGRNCDHNMYGKGYDNNRDGGNYWNED